jgi:hypothetical protein
MSRSDLNRSLFTRGLPAPKRVISLISFSLVVSFFVEVQLKLHSGFRCIE